MPNQYLGVDPMLTKTAIGYKNERMIADLVFPELGVNKQSGKHFTYDRARFRVEETERAAGTNSKEVTLAVGTGSTYFAEDHALKQFVSDEDRDNAITPTTPMVDATENVMDLLKIAKEKELADLITSTANLTQNTTLAGTDQWSDYTNSDPFDDLETGMQTVHSAIGVNPNTLILGKEVFDKLKHHPDLLERVKYSERGVITVEMLANLIGVEQVLIGGAYYTSSAEGQTEATSYVWGKHSILAFVPKRMTPKMIGLGLSYTWNAKTLGVKKLRGSDEDDREGTYVRAGGYYYDQKIVAAAAGYLLKNSVA